MGDTGYKGMPQEWFDQQLAIRVGEAGGSIIGAVPEVYEPLSEHYNNDILAQWDEELSCRFEQGKAAYIKGGGVSCPCCAGTEFKCGTLEWDSPGADVSRLSRGVSCARCGRTWTDIYTLTDVEQA